MKRRTLKQAFQPYQENPSPELVNFVFGEERALQDNQTNGSSLSPTSTFEVGTEIIVSTSKIHKTFSFTPDQKPVRYYYDLDELREWAETDLKPNGVRTALWVRPIPNQPDEYELVAGLRRLLGCEFVGITEVPAKVFNWTDAEAYVAAFDENDRRQDFSKLEELDICLNLLSIRLVMEKEEVVSLLYKMDNEAKGKITQSALGSEAAQLVEEFFKARGDLSWRSFVATRLPLLKKPSEILEAIRSSRIDYTKALEISKLKALEDREALLKTTIDQNLSLIEVKELVKASSQPKDSDADPAAPSTALKARFRTTLKTLDKSSIWADEEKTSKLQYLLDQIDALIG